MSIITINNLCKTYANGVKALNDVSLTIKEGDFFALLGPNGAGKSTLINILSSLVNKTSGSINIAGYDFDSHMLQAKRQLGLMPQEVNLAVFEKVLDILIYQGGYYGIPRQESKQRALELLDRLSLSDKANQISRHLSGGMKRRVMIARALMNRPKVLILDEPTAGVDIKIRRHMWEFLRELNTQGTTIILTTHYLEEAEQLCNEVGIINQGQLICQRDMPSLLRELECETFIAYLSCPIEVLPSVDNIILRRIDAYTLEIDVPRTLGVSESIQVLHTLGIHIQSLRNKTNRLESLFLTLTKNAE